MQNATMTAGELVEKVADSEEPVFLKTEGGLEEVSRAERGEFSDGYIYVTVGGEPTFFDEAYPVEVFSG